MNCIHYILTKLSVETNHRLNENSIVTLGFGSGMNKYLFTQNFLLILNSKSTDFQKKALNFITGQKIILCSSISSQLSHLPKCTVYVSSQPFEKMSNYFPFALLSVSVLGIQTHEFSTNCYDTF